MIVKTEGLRTYYLLLRGITVKAVDGVSIEVPEGSFAGLVGESGSGKTTLAESILYLYEPPMIKIGGKVFYKGIDLDSLGKERLRSLRGREMSYVPQCAMDALNPAMKIKDFIKDLARAHGEDPDDLVSRAAERFKTLGLGGDDLNKYPHELSGGMKQRAVIAISTLLNPEFLVADEPISNLDVVNQYEVMGYLSDLLKKRIIKTLLVVTHDLALILEYADHMIIMYGGQVAELGSKEEILREPLHPYTKMFPSSMPPVGVRIREVRIKGIPGSPPDLRFPPLGCRFHPRCPYAMEICKREAPPMIKQGSKHYVSCWLYVEGEGEGDEPAKGGGSR